MSDFLHNLRTGNIKRFDRPRKNYDNPQYRHPQDRQYNNKERKGNYQKKVHTGEQLKEINKHLEMISQTMENNLAAQEKTVSALERIGTVLETSNSLKSVGSVFCDLNTNQIAKNTADALLKTGITEPDPVISSKEELLVTINALRATGASYEKIASELENRQIPTVSGRGRWRGQAVSKILKEHPA